MNLSEWYRRTVGDDSINQAAEHAGIQQATLNRQLKSGKLTPETVVAVARAYGKSAVKALLIQGLLRRDDVAVFARVEALESASDREIADEVWRRLTKDEPGAHPVFDEPLESDYPPVTRDAFRLATDQEPVSPEDETDEANRTP